jgi:hypothetical protein
MAEGRMYEILPAAEIVRRLVADAKQALSGALAQFPTQ